ncbi:thaumatin family protein [Diplodia corticola]|uniref:Thaumatin family protein n=1 Tax=Diplodia corticola TaxID=236234 RepID=A0A1J9RCD4_9PEZI|nr:thaumatin family protein [Diplodia corticola]OJD30139.1 thaumatin family protein [Diplodia corticola]
MRSSTSHGVACALYLSLLAQLPSSAAIHHMKRELPDHVRRASAGTKPLIVTNKCPDTIYPAFITQEGTGPAKTGFELKTGGQVNQTVSANWQGRVWGRTNCSFPADGPTACGTGDCNGQVECTVSGLNPVSLAEFTLDGGDGQTYYDISLVDGYNLPMGIVMYPSGTAALEGIPQNSTNPSCEGSATQLAASTFNPYTDGSQTFLGTNSSYPLPFDTQVTEAQATRWCPWVLQVNPPSKPGDGVYPYPDDNIQRPAFSPCYSACSKWNKPSDCCVGKYDSPSTCSAGEYSHAAKKVCPDAYSYAFDDQTSTFIIPIGAGFEVVFCPGGRSTNILASDPTYSNAKQSSGHVPHNMHGALGLLLALTMNTILFTCFF